MRTPGARARGRGWTDRLAHDLRGPLAPLQTAVFLLRDARLDPSKRGEMLDLIDRQTKRLGAMIDEIGDLARAERGTLSLQMEEPGLAPLLHEIVEPAPGAATEIRFGPGTDDLHLQGDTARLRQLLRTLATLRLARDDIQPVQLYIERAGSARVRVRRHVGCSGNAVELVEELLYAPLPDPPDGGLGLGLLRARTIAEAHDGSLATQAIDACTIELTLELPLA